MRKQPSRRGFPATRPYVVGSPILNQARTRMGYHAIRSAGDRNPTPVDELTAEVKEWYFWRTKQAASQWRDRRAEFRDLEVRNVNTLNPLM